MHKKIYFGAVLIASAFIISACAGKTSVSEIGQMIQNASAKEETSIDDIDEKETLDAQVKEPVKEETKVQEDTESENQKEDTMSNTESPDALTFASNLKVGWNLGNTLDAWNKGQNNQVNSEVCWGNPKTTKAMMDALKDAGYNTVRIPVTYHNHLTLTDDNRLLVDIEWLSRVKEVVGYGIDNGMYVIINIHHDNEPEGKFGYIPDYDNEEQALWYVEQIWSQVAPYFNEYDEHLIFEGLNEPRLTNDSEHEWWFDEKNDHCLESADVINKLNQKFVDTVRQTGGYNAERYLMIPGYCASIQAETYKGFKIPSDSAKDKIMISTHAYIPYNFALNEDMSYTSFNPDDVNSTYDIDHSLKKLKEKFIDEGIPVVIGEFGCRDKDGNLKDRVEYYKYYVSKCAEYKIPCLVWDNGVFTGNGERFGIFDRNTCEFKYPEIKDAMINAWN